MTMTLVAALAGRHFQLARLFYRDGSSAYPRGFSQQSSLRSAAFYGDLEIVRLLLEFKADVNARDDLVGRTPLHMAARNGHLKAARPLLQHKADNNI